MNNWQQCTDAHLFFAGKLLDVKLGASELVVKNSTLVGAWLSLREAWLCWLNELAEYHGHTGPVLRSLAELVDSGLGEVADVRWLINHKMEPDSWVNVLVSREGQLGNLDDLAKQPIAPEHQSGLIGLKNLDEDGFNHRSGCEQVLRHFKQYVTATRNQQQEW